MKTNLLAVLLLLSISCVAQSIPTEVKTAFGKSFPGISVKKWEKEHGNYEANFSKDGKSMSATFTAAGVLEETETDIKVSELPADAESYIKTHYKGDTIKEAAIVEKGGKKMYEAEVKGKDILFDESGKFLKEQED